MLKIKLRGVASTQKFEENQQSVKSDDDYDISFTFVPFCDVRVIVRSCMLKQAIRNSCPCCSYDLHFRSTCFSPQGGIATYIMYPSVKSRKD